jgi:hypothetical protein
MIGSIAALLGISSLRLYVYAALTVAVVIGGFTIRQHFINAGWNKAMIRVQKQNDAAADAARKVESHVNTCSEENGYWDVVTQGCKMEEPQ